MYEGGSTSPKYISKFFLTNLVVSSLNFTNLTICLEKIDQTLDVTKFKVVIGANLV
jgi:hypothetical protein